MAELNEVISLHRTHEVEPEPEPSQSQPQAQERQEEPPHAPVQIEYEITIVEEQELPHALAQTVSEITLAEEQELRDALAQTESETELAEEQELPQAPAQTESEITLAEEQELPHTQAQTESKIEHAEDKETVAPTQLNLPLQDLFINDEGRTNFINICIPLYEASIKGEWDAALAIFGRPDQDCSRLVKCSITDNCETMLHVAASAQSVEFVTHLLVKMKDEDLQYQNKSGNTALCLAAITGNIDIARLMVPRNRNLLTICNGGKVIPLYMAALYGNRDMVSYLYYEMENCVWTDDHKRWVYQKCVETDLFDIARQIFRDHTELAQQEAQNVLGILARKPYALDESKQPIIQRIFNSVSSFSMRHAANESEAMILLREILGSIHKKPMPEVNTILRGPVTYSIGQSQKKVKTYPSRVLFVAAEKGNTKFIVELILKYPDVIWKTNDDGVSLFHVAVSHRQQDIYKLLYEIGSMKDLIVVLKDKDENNMLHLVGKKVENSRIQDISGAAFQMQREVLWYKEVESMIPPSYRERKNKDGLTPYELFTNTHKDLLSDGEKWMRGTASKSMLVATLIATIVFGVAYTIPGGYDEKLGVPIFRHNVFFLVFVVLDAISLVLSSTSILVFLSILTSRYSQEDFMHSLPKKLMVGLLMLFLSIITMMIAFSVSFYALYRHTFIIIAGFISLLALIPIIAFLKLQYPLLRDVYSSTHVSKNLFKPKRQMLYYRNPSV